MDLVEVNEDLEFEYLMDIYGNEKLAQKNMKTLKYAKDFVEYALGKDDVKI